VIDVNDQRDGEDEAPPVEMPIEDSIDLHAFAPRDIVPVVADYIAAAHAAGFREVRVIHGRGHGIQRGRVQSALERHPLVTEFWDAPDAHLGATIARLRDSP
jgi:DNA-nicking Smr family endonuclease